VTFSARVERRHDDNVLRLSRRDLERFEERPGAPRFRIREPEDDFSLLRAGVDWRFRPFRRRETRFEADVEVRRYDRDDVMNRETFGVSLRQELTASRRHLTTVRVSADHRPDFYLGEVTDADDSFLAGRRIRRSLRYARTRGRLDAERVFARGRAVVTLGVRTEHREYEPYFRERDGRDDAWVAALEARPVHRRGLRMGAVYEAGRFKARGDLPGTEIRDADVSHRHHGLGGFIELPWGRRARRGSLRFAYAPETRSYLTPDKFDILRFGRINRYRGWTVSVTQNTGPLEWRLRYERNTRDAAFPGGVAIDADSRDYEQSGLGVSATLRSARF